jgi:hypothetical protein
MGGHTARIKEVRCLYKILVRKPGGKRLLVNYNIKTNFKETLYVGFIRLRIGNSGRFCSTLQLTFGFRKGRGIS